MNPISNNIGILKNIIISILLGSFIIGGFTSCDKEKVRGCMNKDAINYNPNATEDNSACLFPRPMTQEDLDKTTVVFNTNLTGDFKDVENNLYSSYNHIDFSSSNRTFRDTYGNTQLKGAIISPGIIISHRTYDKSIFGSRDTLMGIAVMYKQVRGYYPEGNDWEYFDIDIKTRSQKHPNGLLPAPNSERRGKLGKCSGCHLQAKGDYLYTFK